MRELIEAADSEKLRKAAECYARRTALTAVCAWCAPYDGTSWRVLSDDEASSGGAISSNRSADQLFRTHGKVRARPTLFL